MYSSNFPRVEQATASSNPDEEFRSEEIEEGPSTPPRAPFAFDEVCGICQELPTREEAASGKLVCTSCCRKTFHRSCLVECRAQQLTLQCPLCRAPTTGAAGLTPDAERRSVAIRAQQRFRFTESLLGHARTHLQALEISRQAALGALQQAQTNHDLARDELARLDAAHMVPRADDARVDQALHGQPLFTLQISMQDELDATQFALAVDTIGALQTFVSNLGLT